MAIGTPRVVVQGGTAAQATSFTLTVPTGGGVAGGQCIVVHAVRSGGAAPTTCTDSVGNTYTKVASVLQGTSHGSAVYVAANVTALPDGGTVTVNADATTDIAFSVLTVTGIATASPVDVTATNTGADGTPTVTGVATAQAEELILGAFAISGNPTWTAGSGYTALGEATSASSFVREVFSEFKNVTAIETPTANCSTSSTTVGWGAILVTLKAGETVATTKVRPASDVTVGSWAPTPLFAQVDEVTADDVDKIGSGTSPSNNICELAFGAASDPARDDFHDVRYRYQGTGDALDLTARLMQGTTEIAAWTHTNVKSWTTVAQRLTTTQASNITNYGDLRLRLTANQSRALVSGGNTRQAPDAIVASANYGLSPLVATIQDDPDLADSLWITAENVNEPTTSMRVSFATPSGNLTTDQEFRVLLRKVGGTNTPAVTVSLYDGGTLISSGLATDVTSTTGAVLSYVWDGTGRSAANIECHFAVGAQGGKAAAKSTVDVGAIEWNARTTGDVAGAVEVSWAEFELPATSTKNGTGNGTAQVDGAGAGSRVATGSGAATAAADGAGAGSRVATGQASGTAAVDGAGAGSRVLTGTAAGTAATDASGSGVRIATGSGGGSADVIAAGAGSKVATAAGGGTAAVDGAGSGTLVAAGAGGGTANVTGEGAGGPVVAATGTGDGTASVAGSGAGAAVRTGTGAATVDVTGSGSGTAVPTGLGDGTAIVVGEGAGTAVSSTVQGTGAATADVTSSGSGAAVAAGAGSASASVGGAGSGSPVLVAAGSALLGVAGQAQGAAVLRGMAAAEVTVTAAGAGVVVAAMVRVVVTSVDRAVSATGSAVRSPAGVTATTRAPTTAASGARSATGVASTDRPLATTTGGSR